MSPLTRAAPTASPATASAPLRERSNPLRAGSKRPAAARRGAARATARLASPSAAAARASRTRVSGTLPRRGASLVPTAVADPPASSTAPAEAGGAADFDWHNQWYPVAFLDDLDDSAPLTFTLLGEPLVFWRDPTCSELTFRCTADKCPHRLVPLSEGRVNEKGEIECGYHGWTFKGDTGACTNIPQLPAEGTAMDTALASPRSCVTPYHTQVAQCILWVYPVSKMACGDDIDALPALPLIPELEHPDCVCQVRVYCNVCMGN